MHQHLSHPNDALTHKTNVLSWLLILAPHMPTKSFLFRNCQWDHFFFFQRSGDSSVLVKWSFVLLFNHSSLKRKYGKNAGLYVGTVQVVDNGCFRLTSCPVQMHVPYPYLRSDWIWSVTSGLIFLVGDYRGLKLETLVPGTQTASRQPWLMLGLSISV